MCMIFGIGNLEEMDMNESIEFSNDNIRYNALPPIDKYKKKDYQYKLIRPQMLHRKLVSIKDE